LIGTLVEITVFEKDENKAELAIQNTFNEIQRLKGLRLEGLMSTHIPGSEVYLINQTAGVQSVTVSPRCSRSSNRLYIGAEKQTVLWI
jgi:thiamine biosynthesis lipoprotein ApbE